MPKLKARKLDASTKQQAIAAAQWLIGIRGWLSHEYSRDYWRFSTKAELCGQVEAARRQRAAACLGLFRGARPAKAIAVDGG